MGLKRWTSAWLLAIILVTQLGVAQQSNSTAGRQPLSVEEVVKNLQQKNHERAEALRQFHGTRVYRMQYRGFPSDRDAEMTVNVNYRSPGKEEFTVISQSGSKFIIDHVFKKLLEGEQEAASEENQRRTALSAENYDFRMEGYRNAPSGPQYILEVIPKSKNKFLYRGKIWVDARDFAVTEIKAEPAKTPSVWIKKTDIEHRYVKVEDFWLPAENRSESIIRLGGRATLTIEYRDYKVMAARPLNQIQGSHESSAIAVLSP
jgi:outer membrane lipoprotein-sorting protein